MQEKWNQFVYVLCEAKKRGVEEDAYHAQIENQLQFLGWMLYKGEICHKSNIPIGNNKYIQPDILIKKDGEDQFVIEVKRPVHSQTERERVQLESYMRQLKIEVGIYIGEHIEVFYDMPKRKDAVSVLKIPLELDNKLGAKFVDRFSKDNFSKESIVAFCEERIKEMQRQANLNKIRENLISDAQMHITESLKPYLMEKYGDSFSEEDIRGMLTTLKFIATDKEGLTEDVPLPVVTQQDDDGNQRKKTYDSTHYSLDGGPMLGKNQLAYAIVSSYIKQHPDTTFEELESIFPPQLQGSFGVVRTLDYIREKGYKGRRYFDESDEILKSSNGISFVVSTQWGKENLPNIIDVAIKLGFRIGTSLDADRKPQKAPATIQSEVIKCFITRNSNAQGLFNPADQSLTVLKGSKVNPHHVDKISDASRRKRDKQLADYTKEVQGERIVTKDIPFKSPSGASDFCVGGSSNGWDTWKDIESRKLKIYRKK